MSKFVKGHPAPKTAFKKGHSPWNKDKKGIMPKPWNTGMKNPYSKKQLEKMRESTKNLWENPEYRKKLVVAHTGKKQEIEQIEKRIKSLKEAHRIKKMLGIQWNPPPPKKGVKRSLETIKKMKENRKPYKATIETRLKKSDSMKGKNSKGGLTPINAKIRGSIEFRLWREAAFARDNWICQKTKIKGGELHPHHILNFAEHPELRFAIDNGITLSKKAHKEFHSKYGRRNNTREQLLEFINNK